MAAVIVTRGALENCRWAAPVVATVAIPLLAYCKLSLLIAVVPLALPAVVPHLARWLPRSSAS
jgi:hypothetical protein